METHVKTGLVVEGGGMKCAYSAGILDRFLDEDIHFDYVIGVSAGASNSASYLAKQRGRNLRFYTDHITDKRYFGAYSFLTTGDIFGLDHIYSTLTNSDGADPIDLAEIKRDPAEYEIVVTNAVTGRPEFISKETIHQDEYEVFKATSCIPAVCRARHMNGNAYFDGGLSDPIPVDRAVKMGCKKMVVILSKPRDYVKEPQKMMAFVKLRCRKYPRIIKIVENRHKMYMKRFRKIFELEEQGRAFVFAPSEHLAGGTYKMDPDGNYKLYELGIADFDARREELRKFLES